jgi:glutamyl-tRNA synthetase
MNNAENIKKASLLFPGIKLSVGDFVKKYPLRVLPANAKVTRFGPSPTGFLHIGGIFTALVSERLAHQSNGIFILRIEDTDKAREIEGGVMQMVRALDEFGITIDEGLYFDGKETGEYGPYKQSERLDIYKAFAKFLIEKDRAYPCFCTKDELEMLKNKQESEKVRPGYYGKWAKHRNLTLEEIDKKMKNGENFVIRLKSDITAESSFIFPDLIKGNVSVTENDNDIVLIKADGYPTYHFAHVVDDYLMGTTHVIRGDEWLSSLPTHLQVFKFIGKTAPLYGHLSPILKSDNGGRRKLSKRKDPEASVDFYSQKGYPRVSIIEYLLNIANSDFEDWRKNNPNVPNTDFLIKLERFSKSGALFDINKLNNISKEIISKMSAGEVFENTLQWADLHDKEFASSLRKDKEYYIKIFSIERGGNNPRKDISSWSEIKNSISFFFNFPEGETGNEIMDLYPNYLEKKEIQVGKERNTRINKRLCDSL